MIYDIQMKRPETDTYYNVIVQSSFPSNSQTNTSSSNIHKKPKREYSHYHYCLMM